MSETSPAQSRSPLAILADLCHVDVTATARCENCTWTATEPNHGSALNVAARHIEAEGHRAVVVTTTQLDIVMAVPDLPRYRDRRVLK